MKAKFCPSCGNPISWKEEPKKKCQKNESTNNAAFFVGDWRCRLHKVTEESKFA